MNEVAPAPQVPGSGCHLNNRRDPTPGALKELGGRFPPPFNDPELQQRVRRIPTPDSRPRHGQFASGT